MARESVTIDGGKLLRRKLERLPKIVRKQVNTALTRSAREMADTMRASIKRDSGHWRQHGDHWSAPPGMPPNEDTGELRRSIKVSKRASLSRGATAMVDVDAFYASWLEFGTKHMEPRPFIGPAWAEVLPIARRHIRDLVRDAMRRLRE